MYCFFEFLTCLQLVTTNYHADFENFIAWLYRDFYLLLGKWGPNGLHARSCRGKKSVNQTKEFTNDIY